jgi:ATP-dependent exoDNAse (exonuclease V) beta subunit
MQEIVDILNALRVAYDPGDVIALLGLARSPYIGLSDEELFMLARTCKKDRSDLFEKLSGHPKGTIISNLDRLKKSLSVSEMIVALANDRMTDNIGQLYNMVRSAEDQGLLDPPSIVSYLEDIRQRGLGMAEFPQSGKDAVIITTIHQAKGLEFDNVILADLFRGKISHNSKWLFVRGKDSGLSFKLTPEDNPVADAVPSDYFKTLLKHNEDADAEERRRLLYVAMTRAKERLFIPIHSEITRDGPWHKELSEKIAAYENIEWVIPASNSVIPAKAGIHLIQPESYNISPSLLPAPRSENGSSAMAAARHGSYSVSELEAYARSPQEYYANFVLGVPPDRPLDENSLPTNIHGDIVHKMIERLKRSTAITPEKLFANIIGEMNISSVSEKEKTAILAKVRLFLGTSHGAVKNSMHELPFMLKVGDDFVKGTIDMFVPASGAGDVWEIFDFKTGYLDDPTDALKKYDLQIRTYALAVTAGGLAKGNGRVTLLFLSDKGTTPISMDINEGVLKDTAEEINVIIKKVAEGFSLPQLMEP